MTLSANYYWVGDDTQPIALGEVSQLQARTWFRPIDRIIRRLRRTPAWVGRSG